MKQGKRINKKYSSEFKIDVIIDIHGNIRDSFLSATNLYDNILDQTKHWNYISTTMDSNALKKYFLVMM